MISKPVKRENTLWHQRIFLIRAQAPRNVSVVPSLFKFGIMNVPTHSRGPEQSGEVLTAHVLGFAGSGTRKLDGLEVVTDKHSMQIASLTSQIEVKNEEISKCTGRFKGHSAAKQ